MTGIGAIASEKKTPYQLDVTLWVRWSLISQVVFFKDHVVSWRILIFDKLYEEYEDCQKCWSTVYSNFGDWIWDLARWGGGETWQMIWKQPSSHANQLQPTQLKTGTSLEGNFQSALTRCIFRCVSISSIYPGCPWLSQGPWEKMSLKIISTLLASLVGHMGRHQKQQLSDFYWRGPKIRSGLGVKNSNNKPEK